MAEGTTPSAEVEELLAVETTEPDAPEETVTTEAAVVRLKQKEMQQEVAADECESQAAADKPLGRWWKSPVLQNCGEWRGQPSETPGLQFQGWRERRWTEDEDGDWSYSTGLGASTLDILRDKFGEASFCDAPSWQPWAPGGEGQERWTGTSGPGSGTGSGGFA